MDHIILFRDSDGIVRAIMNGDDIAVFANRDEAIDAAEAHPLLQTIAYQIVCLDEL